MDSNIKDRSKFPDMMELAPRVLFKVYRKKYPLLNEEDLFVKIFKDLAEAKYKEEVTKK